MDASIIISTILSSVRSLVASWDSLGELQNLQSYTHALSMLTNAWYGACMRVGTSSTLSMNTFPALVSESLPSRDTSSNSPGSLDMAFFALVPPNENTTEVVPAPGPAVDLLAGNGSLNPSGSLTRPPASSSAFSLAVSGLTFASIRHRLWCHSLRSRTRTASSGPCRRTRSPSSSWPRTAAGPTR